MLQWTWSASDKFSEVRSLGQKAVPFLIFWGTSILLSTVAVPVCTPTNSAKGFPFLHILSSTCFLLIYWCVRCEVISAGFNLHFSDDQWCSASSHMSIGRLHVLFGEISIYVLCLTIVTDHNLPDFDRTICHLTYMSTSFLKVPVTKFTFDHGVYYTDFTICYL